MKRNRHPLSQKEVKQLAELMSKVEDELIQPLRNISGGFAETHLHNWTKDKIYIQVLFGIQDGFKNEVHDSIVTIDRAQELTLSLD